MQKIATIFLLFFSVSLSAQNSFSISGTVTDNDDKLISVADVLLYPIATDTLIKYTSVFDGDFLIENIQKGKYRIKISCLGFKEEEQIIELDKNSSIKIQLTESTTNLDEVDIIAVKPILITRNGNLKIDVTNPIFSSIPNPIDLLSKLPNVQVGSDGESVSIIGKGVPLIYVENQRVTLQEFQSLNVDDINTIEIIKNPSAKYEANGRAVLLITRKKDSSEGYELNLSETASFKRNFNNYTNLNGSFKTGRLTIKANFAYNDLLQWESHQFEFAIPEADIFSNYRILVDKNDRIEFNSGGGLFYQFNDTNYFSANITRRLQTNNTIINTITFLQQGVSEDDIITETDNERIKDFVSGNLNYNMSFNSKNNMFFGAQYSSYIQSLNTDIANNFNANGFNLSQLREQRYRINVLAYRLDFERKFRNDFKLEFGTNISDARANALTNIEFLETNTALDVDYDYSEKNIAGYSTLSGELGTKLNFNAGLRIEKNIVKGEDKEENIPLVNRRKTSLFPKVNVTKKIDSTKNVSFNYAKSIMRPNYSNVSSIQVFFNPFLEGEGNVNLLPTFTEEVSATYQFSKYALSLELYKNKNPIYYTISYEDGADRAVFSLKNLKKETGFNINLTMPLSKGIWTSSNTVSLSAKKIEDVSIANRTVTPYLYLFTDHQFKIAKETTLSFGGWGLTKRSEGIFERNAMFVFNAAIAKTFFKKFHFSLQFNDITKAMNFKENYAINGVVADGVYYVDAQEIAFAMKYTFRKKEAPKFKNKDVDDNLNRIR